jgi:hypothetical protein
LYDLAITGKTEGMANTNQEQRTPAETGLVTKLRHWAAEAQSHGDGHLSVSLNDVQAMLRTAQSALDEARTLGKVEACEEVLEIGRRMTRSHDFDGYITVIDAELQRHREQLDD